MKNYLIDILTIRPDGSVRLAADTYCSSVNMAALTATVEELLIAGDPKGVLTCLAHLTVAHDFLNLETLVHLTAMTPGYVTALISALKDQLPPIGSSVPLSPDDQCLGERLLALLPDACPKANTALIDFCTSWETKSESERAYAIRYYGDHLSRDPDPTSQANICVLAGDPIFLSALYHETGWRCHTARLLQHAVRASYRLGNRDQAIRYASDIVALKKSAGRELRAFLAALSEGKESLASALFALKGRKAHSAPEEISMFLLFWTGLIEYALMLKTPAKSRQEAVKALIVQLYGWCDQHPRRITLLDRVGLHARYEVGCGLARLGIDPAVLFPPASLQESETESDAWQSISDEGMKTYEGMLVLIGMVNAIREPEERILQLEQLLIELEEHHGGKAAPKESSSMPNLPWSNLYALCKEKLSEASTVRTAGPAPSPDARLSEHVKYVLDNLKPSSTSLETEIAPVDEDPLWDPGNQSESLTAVLGDNELTYDTLVSPSDLRQLVGDIWIALDGAHEHVERPPIALESTFGSSAFEEEATDLIRWFFANRKFGEADILAASLRDDFSRGNAQSEIVFSQVLEGNIQSALKTVRKIDNKVLRVSARCELAMRLFEMGYKGESSVLVEEAIELTKALGENTGTTLAVSELLSADLVNALIRIGMFEQAIQMLSRISPGWMRERAESHLIGELTKAGRYEEAAEAAHVYVGTFKARHNSLIGIACEAARHPDRESFASRLVEETVSAIKRTGSMRESEKCWTLLALTEWLSRQDLSDLARIAFDAAFALSATIESPPTRLSLEGALCVGLARIGEAAQALAYAGRLQIDPDTRIGAECALAVVLADRGETKAATTALANASATLSDRRIDGLTPELWLGLAYAHSRLGMPEDAFADLKTACMASASQPGRPNLILPVQLAQMLGVLRMEDRFEALFEDQAGDNDKSARLKHLVLESLLGELTGISSKQYPAFHNWAVNPIRSDFFKGLEEVPDTEGEPDIKPDDRRWKIALDLIKTPRQEPAEEEDSLISTIEDFSIALANNGWTEHLPEILEYLASRDPDVYYKSLYTAYERAGQAAVLRLNGSALTARLEGIAGIQARSAYMQGLASGLLPSVAGKELTDMILPEVVAHAGLVERVVRKHLIHLLFIRNEDRDDLYPLFKQMELDWIWDFYRKMFRPWNRPPRSSK